MLALAGLALLSGCSEEKPAEKAGAEQGRTIGTAEQTKAAEGRKERDRKPERKASSAVPVGKGFDFYVLSLSWSPSWCAANDPQGDTQQCRAGKRHGLIVHGLWPQNERGYPEFCRSRDPDRVPESLGRSMFDLIPSMGLIGHQWRKHGSCSGLSQVDYFKVVREARQRIKLPAALDRPDDDSVLDIAAIEAGFVRANKGLTQTGVAVTCEGRIIEEIRICMTPSLDFRSCPEVDRQSCRVPRVEIPPVN